MISRVDLYDSPVYAELFLELPLFVVFGGLKNNTNIAPFEMFNILSGYNCSKLLLRDFDQVWFLKTDYINLIKQTITISNPTKVFLLGSSAGGFSAIKHASKILPDKTVVFSPQINISQNFMASINDNRWVKNRRKAYNLCSDVELDVSSYDIDVDIHVSKEKRDLCHAKSSVYNIIIHNTNIHPVSHYLKKEGILNNILKSMVML